MDINFHYFAVKALTVSAGFEEIPAQLIATYSQFVDDFDNFNYMLFSDVPEYAQYLATYIPVIGVWAFNPVTTGFTSWTDYPKLLIERNQRRILIPFHFITSKPIDQKVLSRKEYRTQPVTMGQQSLMQSILKNAADLYKQSATRENMMRLGTLVHTFADTYAHQRFSGFWGWENNTYLADVVDNISHSNVTSDYHPDLYFRAPSVGHANVSTAPDDSNVSFAIIQKDREQEDFPYHQNYSRSNPLEFLAASREILNYLRDCRGLGPIDDGEWTVLSDKLTQGFLTTEKDPTKLSTYWNGIFPEIDFYYNKPETLTDQFTAAPLDNFEEVTKDTTILMSLLSGDNNENINKYIVTEYNDDFFLYNVIADQIRKQVDPTISSIDPEFDKYVDCAKLQLKVVTIEPNLLLKEEKHE